MDVHATDQKVGELVGTLNHLLDRLQRAFESLRQFAGDVSHQIQTPLAIMKGIGALGGLRSVSVESHVEPQVTVRGDAVRLKHVVLNVDDNAVKYTQEGGHVAIHPTQEIR